MQTAEGTAAHYASNESLISRLIAARKWGARLHNFTRLRQPTDGADKEASSPDSGRLTVEDQGEQRAALAANLLWNALNAAESHTAAHCSRVADLTREIGIALGLSAAEVDLHHKAALVHDVGKIAIPAQILLKPGRLTEQEMAVVKTHAAIGHDMLCHSDVPASVREIVRDHHERLDGSGYPNGLRAREISIGARIVAVADSLDAMVALRSYRAPKSVTGALEELFASADRSLDRDVLRCCKQVLRGIEGRYAAAQI